MEGVKIGDTKRGRQFFSEEKPANIHSLPGGADEVVVQGDNSDDIFDWVTEVGNVPEDNVDMIEDKKKKVG